MIKHNSHNSSSPASAADISDSSLVISCSLICCATDIMSEMTLGSMPEPPRFVNPQICPFRFIEKEIAELI